MTVSTLHGGVPQYTQPGEQEVKKMSSHSNLGNMSGISVSEDIQQNEAKEKSLLRKIDWK